MLKQTNAVNRLGIKRIFVVIEGEPDDYILKFSNIDYSEGNIVLEQAIKQYPDKNSGYFVSEKDGEPFSNVDIKFHANTVQSALAPFIDDTIGLLDDVNSGDAE